MNEEKYKPPELNCNFMKRIFIAAFGAETNSFSARMTTLDHFKKDCLIRPGESKNSIIANDGHGEFIRQANIHGYEVVWGTLAYATPSGPLTRETYELLRDEMVEQLKQALPVDFVLLNLHGAMIAEGYDDCEGDFLESIRRVAGSDIPVGGLLDPHAHLSQSMIDNATVLVAYKEYPHTDFAESARKLFKMTDQAARKNIKPIMASFDCHSFGSFPTPTSPMREFVDHYLLGETPEKILDCSLIHSFPWGDSPDAGVKVLVTSDANKDIALSYAEQVGHEFRKIRQNAIQKFSTVSEAMAHITQSEEKPIIIADTADNPGGGASGDATHILDEVIKQEDVKAAFGFFWDSESIEKIFSAGEGGEVTISLGGKESPYSGKPMTLDCVVLGVSSDAAQFFGEGDDQRALPIGKCAAVRVGNVDIIITDRRQQIVSPDIFESFGLDLTTYDVIVVKSSNHFQAAFKAITSRILYVMTPGVMSVDFNSLPYKKIPRPIWPLDEI